MTITVKQLKNLLENLNDDAPVTVVNEDQDFCIEIIDGITCDDNSSEDHNNFLDLVVSTKSLREVAKEVVRSEEQIRVSIPPEQFTDIIVDDKLELHITNGYDGYTIDAYKHLEQKEMDEDHDFDEDFLTSMAILHSDLEENED